METKRCAGKCAAEKTIDSFDSTKSGFLKGKCRDCLRDENTERVAAWRKSKRPEDWTPKYKAVDCSGSSHSCNACGTVKPHSGYYKDKTGACGFESRCKDCRQEERRSRWAENKGGHRDKHEARMQEPVRRSQTLEYLFEYRLRTSFNITPDQYEWLLTQQNGVCALCFEPERKIHHKSKTGEISRLAVDHDHRCCSESAKSCGKCIRGLLCNSCNTVMGKIEEKPALAKRFADYVDRRPLSDFYEEDEPVEEIVKAFDGGEEHVTVKKDIHGDVPEPEVETKMVSLSDEQFKAYMQWSDDQMNAAFEATRYGL